MSPVPHVQQRIGAVGRELASARRSVLTSACVAGASLSGRMMKGGCMRSVSVARIQKNRYRTTIAKRMVETRAELPFIGDQVGLFRAQPGRRKRTCNSAWRNGRAINEIAVLTGAGLCPTEPVCYDSWVLTFWKSLAAASAKALSLISLGSESPLKPRSSQNLTQSPASILCSGSIRCCRVCTSISLLASSTALAIRSNARYLSSSFTHFAATSRPASRLVSTRLRRLVRRRLPTSSIVLFPSNSRAGFVARIYVSVALALGSALFCCREDLRLGARERHAAPSRNLTTLWLCSPQGCSMNLAHCCIRCRRSANASRRR